MGSSKIKISSKSALPFRSNNKEKRKDFHLKQKLARAALKREQQFRRKKEEDRDPALREERRARNVPQTIDSKRVWDEYSGDEGDDLGLSVDVLRGAKRVKVGEAQEDEEDAALSESEAEEDAELEDDDVDSMLDEEEPKSDASESDPSTTRNPKKRPASSNPNPRATSPSGSTTSTNLNLAPEKLAQRYPTLFAPPPSEPKVLITTSINSTLHKEAELLTTLFPGSHYVPRSSHRYSHKYSICEISRFASSRGFHSLVILMEDQKRPSGLDIVHLPSGPMFHFTLTSFVSGSRIPGHGRPTNHYPELILNGFRTPLGLLTAHLFKTLFPAHPELQGRQVVTLHNQRDYIFLRRHRYVFREKRASEKSVVDAAGKAVKGVEDIRAGLQELGPSFTLKLRRVDAGVQRASGQVWEWRSRSEKARTRFQM
ncbi:Brix-domain-containing protein [Patellaria atrata CBS 101060]|uniref:Brix-domain-containing protein n=1 Tax=Patellaria atrata CBS 101060 TaxID=1346257 RepID=A0A9P4VVF2_9PEZI|nr:Brix-domain-containing protein [Patellaria atrata CBS 101060]